MNLLSYIKSLTGIFDRNRVFELLNSLSGQLKGRLVDAYSTAVGQLDNKSSQGFHSQFAIKQQKTFVGLVRPRNSRLSYIAFTEGVLVNITYHLELLKNMAEKHIGKNVAPEGMSLVVANILQITQVCDFIVQYAQRNLLATLGSEIAAERKDDNLKSNLTPAEWEWLDKYRDDFYRACIEMSVTPGDLRNMLSNVPDMIVPPDDFENVASVVGHGKVQPLRLGLIDAQYNPIFRIRLQIANWQVANYRAIEAELEAIELRLNQLKYSRDGTPNPALDKEISDTEERVSDLYFTIEDLRKKYKL